MLGTSTSAYDVPGATRYHCPICGAVTGYQLDAWSDHRPLATKMRETEAQAEHHLRGRHPLRYWLWRRTGWRRALAS